MYDFAVAIPQEIQNRLHVTIPTAGFLLANSENLSLVLARESDTGLASVEGWEISPKIELGGFQLSVIVAESVSFTKEGTPATVGEILANPTNYEFHLVKVDATRRHVSVLYDPDDGTGIEFPVTAGYLVENPVQVPELIKGAVREGREIVSDLSKGIVQSIVTQEQSRLPVFDFETDYWVDSPAVTNGIVLLPGSRILSLLENVVPEAGQLVQLETDRPTLYDVKTDLKSQPVSSVQEIRQNPDAYRDVIVELTVYGYQATISIQEALREVIPCMHGNINWIDIQTPEGPICAPVPLDVRLEGMVAWSTLSTPPTRDELLIVAGASSVEQDTVFESQLAEFRLVGKVVSTKTIDESLPEGLALIIFKEEKISNITIQELARERIGENLAELNWVLTNFSESTIPGIPTPTMTTTTTTTTTSPLSITTTSLLPGGTIGFAYSFTLSATGGTPPYYWSVLSSDIEWSTLSSSVESNGVPVIAYGLTLNPSTGVISGIPQPAPGGWGYETFFTVEVTDNNGNTATANLSFYIGFPLQTTTTSYPLATTPTFTTSTTTTTLILTPVVEEPWIWVGIGIAIVIIIVVVALVLKGRGK